MGPRSSASRWPREAAGRSRPSGLASLSPPCGRDRRMTGWAVRHFTPGDVDHWLNLAVQRAP